jgi:hypothetical protein
MKTALRIFLSSSFALLLVSGTKMTQTAGAQDDLPSGQGKAELVKVCTQCHSIESIPRIRYTREEWANLVYSMKDMGADATGEELETIINYLAKNFNKDKKD